MDKYDFEFIFRLLVNVACVVVSLAISFFTWLLGSFYFSDVSKLNGNGVGPTVAEVTKTSLLSFVAWALAAGFVVTAIAVFAHVATRHANDKSLIPDLAIKRLVIVCWLILCSGPMISAAQYFLT